MNMIQSRDVYLYGVWHRKLGGSPSRRRGGRTGGRTGLRRGKLKWSRVYYRCCVEYWGMGNGDAAAIHAVVASVFSWERCVNFLAGMGFFPPNNTLCAK